MDDKKVTIDQFEEAKKIADIKKNKDKPDELKIEYVDGVEIKKEKTTYAKVVNNSEIVNIYESGNFKSNQERYYKSTRNVKEGGDIASDTNYIKYSLALKNLNECKTVEIYELHGSKKENLKKFEKLNRGRGRKKFPEENYQMNKEKIPREILKQKKKDMKEYENNKKNNTVKSSDNTEDENENK